jgi:hypothetical protein
VAGVGAGAASAPAGAAPVALAQSAKPGAANARPANKIAPGPNPCFADAGDDAASARGPGARPGRVAAGGAVARP